MADEKHISGTKNTPLQIDFADDLAITSDELDMMARVLSSVLDEIGYEMSKVDKETSQSTKNGLRAVSTQYGTPTSKANVCENGVLLPVHPAQDSTVSDAVADTSHLETGD